MPSSEWYDSIVSDDDYQKDQLNQTVKGGALCTHADGYKPEYDEIAYEMMQDADSTMTRVALSLRVSMRMLRDWRRRHPSFLRAIETGRIIGEEKFREMLYLQALKPSSEVNNTLIKLLAGNVHGIKEDKSPHILIQNNQNINFSKEESSSIYADAMNTIDHVEDDE